jgi:hypothetical protein
VIVEPPCGKIARPLVEDDALPVIERTDALQIVLVGLPENEKVPFAIQQLSSPHLELQGKALASLTGDEMGLHSLRDGVFDLSAYHSYNNQVPRPSGQPIEPEPPSGLQAEPLLPLLDSNDPKFAAQAGYLLALLERPDGLPHLVAFWRTRVPNDPTWMRLVYRAISKLDDGAQVPALKEIYARASH